jgi:hypothetical protein
VEETKSRNKYTDGMQGRDKLTLGNKCCIARVAVRSKQLFYQLLRSHFRTLSASQALVGPPASSRWMFGVTDLAKGYS